MLFSQWKLFRPISALRRRVAQYARRPAFLASQLGFKLLAIVACVVILGMTLSSILTLSLHRDQLMDSAQLAARRVTVAIQASLEPALSSHDHAILAAAIAEVPGETGVERVRLLDMTGQIRLSSVESEAGARFGFGAPHCAACHRGGASPVAGAIPPASQITEDALLNVQVIANRPTCQRCHGQQATTLGLLLVETPLAELNAQLRASLWRMMLAALGTMALLVGLMMPALNRLVIRPVRALARGAVEIGAGNLEFQLPAGGDDELGDLARSFQAMQQRLKTDSVAMEQRNRELAMLNEIARTTNQLLDPQQILELTIDIAVNSLGVAAGAVALLDADRGRFTLHACKGMSGCTGVACRLRAVHYAVAGMAEQNSELLYVPDLAADRRFYGLWEDPQGRSYIGIPLNADGAIIGTMAFITHPGQRLTDEGAHTLNKIGDEVGRTLMHAFRYQHARYYAAVEERDRLAREMHDSLAQALAYLKLKASVADELLSRGQIDKARENLGEVREIASETYTDVREAIFNLRESAQSGMEFFTALDHYLAEYRLHYGLPVTFHLAGDGTRPVFSAEVGIEVYRIVQEALTNVRKHARASQAWVRLARAGNGWQITVEDDGCGFDPAHVSRNGQQHIGMQIMRERAESVGAALELDSQPGQGTRVTVRVPPSPGNGTR